MFFLIAAHRTIMNIHLFLMLVAGYYMADFALQDDFIAKNKADAGKTAVISLSSY